MGVNLSKVPHVIFFAGMLPILSLALAWCFSQVVPNPPFWLETLSPLVGYGILYSIFEKYLWRWSIFRWTGVTVCSDLRGRWKGSQQSSYKIDNKNVVVQAYLEIKQSFSHVSVCAYYEKSQSASVTASFVETANGDYLYYTYDNEPNSLKEGTMQIHRGTVKLKCSAKNRLLGVYFNTLGNQGEMDFEFEQAQLLHRF